MTNRGRIDLSIGGNSWAGWRFGSWGMARDWRILTPSGLSITAPEIESIPTRSADLAFLQSLSRDQAEKLSGSTLALTPDETALVRVAMQVLMRELPVQLGRRDAAVRPSGLLQAVK